MAGHDAASDDAALRAALQELRAENRDLSHTLETLYQMNRELETENEKLKLQRDGLLDRLKG
jgi:FtsZ-binding cell division protein ZapB